MFITPEFEEAEEEFHEKKGLALLIEPLVGGARMVFTNLTAIALCEILKTEHGRSFMLKLPDLVTTTFAHNLHSFF